MRSRVIQGWLATCAVAAIGLLASQLISEASAAARGQPSKPAPNVAAKVSAEKEVAAAARAEAKVLRAQLQTMRDYDERLVATVYWSLGTVTALFLALIGFNWWSNTRSYQRDKDALRQELKGLQEQHLARLETQIGEAISKRIDEVRTEAVMASKAVAAELGSQIGQTANDVVRLDMTIEIMEGADWERRGVITNALRSCCKCLRMQIQHPVLSWRLSRSLDVMDRLLRNPDLAIDANQRGEITRVLKELPAEHTPSQERLMTLLRQVRSG
jgi:hypothetical protein